MKNYNKNIEWGTAIIEITLQLEEFIGHYRIKLTGNTKGAELLEEGLRIDFLEDEDIIYNDCNLKFIKSDNIELDDSEGFECTLANGEDTLELSGVKENLQDYIVKVEIIEYTEKE